MKPKPCGSGSSGPITSVTSHSTPNQHLPAWVLGGPTQPQEMPQQRTPRGGRGQFTISFMKAAHARSVKATYTGEETPHRLTTAKDTCGTIYRYQNRARAASAAPPQALPWKLVAVFWYMTGCWMILVWGAELKVGAIITVCCWSCGCSWGRGWSSGAGRCGGAFTGTLCSCGEAAGGGKGCRGAWP